MVHLVNFTSRHAAKIPKKIKNSARDFLHQFLYLTDSLLKVNLKLNINELCLILNIFL